MAKVKMQRNSKKRTAKNSEREKRGKNAIKKQS
jgi:hypothetical protein